MEAHPVIPAKRRVATFLALWAILAQCLPVVSIAGVELGSVKTESTVEEVSVYGQKPTDLLKMLLQSDRQVYDFFNDWNMDDQFDMVCRMEARIGSQIHYQVCRPRFVNQAEAIATEDSRDTGFLNVNRAKMRRLRQQQRELMANLANESPEFMEYLKERGEIRKAYQEARGQKLDRPSWEVMPDSDKR